MGKNRKKTRIENEIDFFQNPRKIRGPKKKLKMEAGAS